MKKKKKISRTRKRIKKIFWTVVIVFFVLTVIPVCLYKFIPVKYTPLMVIRHFEYKSSPKKIVTKKQWVFIGDISINLQLAAIAAEDDQFIEHSGFDFDAIQKAYKLNKKRSRKIRGGSTISQQTAKNVFLWPGRSWIRKGLELYFTVLIEGIWGKERIMEVYLNVVELGYGIYGAEAASQFYFDKPASDLNKAEAAALVSILPNPRKFSMKKPSPYIQRYRNAIVRRMEKMEKVIWTEER